MTSPGAPVSPSDISFVVPVGGAAPAWHRAAESLALLDPRPREIIAVIDGPNDKLVMKAAQIGARVIVLEKQSGPAKARNRGAEAASGDILFFVDSDIEVPNDLAGQIAPLFSTTGEPTAIIGSYDDSPGDPDFLSQYRNLQHHYVHQTGRKQASTFWSGCGAIRTETFRTLGGFDESYTHPSIEDIELGSRILKAGHSIHLIKDLQVKHLKKWTPRNMLHTDLWRRAVPWTELMLKDGALVNDLNVKTKERFSVIFAFLLLVAILFVPLSFASVGIAFFSGIGILNLNRGFFGFLKRARGWSFALNALPWFWFYLLICGIGFGLGMVKHVFRRRG